MPFKVRRNTVSQDSKLATVYNATLGLGARFQRGGLVLTVSIILSAVGYCIEFACV
jgi:hypothetical protein